MVTTTTDAGLRYLQRVSEQLLSSSPAVSAHLQAKRHLLASEHDLASESPERSCKACGSILIPGWSCKTATSTLKKRTRPDRLARESTLRLAKVQCGRCNTVTTIERHKLKTSRRASHHDAALTSTAEQTAKTNDDNHKEANKAEPASTPTRKRSRGKKSSLQSMIAKKTPAQTSTAGSFGLGFADLLKS